MKLSLTDDLATIQYKMITARRLSREIDEVIAALRAAETRIRNSGLGTPDVLENAIALAKAEVEKLQAWNKE